MAKPQGALGQILGLAGGQNIYVVCQHQQLFCPRPYLGSAPNMGCGSARVVLEGAKRKKSAATIEGRHESKSKGN